MTARKKPLAVAEKSARNGRLAAGVNACFSALAADPDEVLAHALLAHLFLEGDFCGDAISSATRAIELDPLCTPAYLTLGLACDRRGGMWDRSILVWHELAEVAPDLVLAQVQLGEAYAAVAFEEEAIAAWRAALELSPGDARAMYNLAIMALKRMGMATALPGFRKAGELDQTQDDFFFSLAGVHDDGVPAPDPAQVASDRDSRLNAAFALAFEEELFSAAELIRLVLDENADDADALALAGYLYLKQEAANEAMAVALRSLAISTSTPTAVYVLGAAFAKRKGLSRNAARVFGALARAVPGHPMSHVLLAEAFVSLQRYEAAKDSYRCAVELDPACVRARFGLAAVLLTEGEYALAQRQMRRAAYHDTRRRGVYWQLYDAYSGRGKR